MSDGVWPALVLLFLLELVLHQRSMSAITDFAAKQTAALTKVQADLSALSAGTLTPADQAALAAVDKQVGEVPAQADAAVAAMAPPTPSAP